MKVLNVGIIGAGMMGEQHAEAIGRIPGTRIVALANDVPQVAEAFCEKYNIPKYYTDYHEMLENEQLDIVHNCTPNFLHYSISKAVIEKRIHIYCEKPLANTSQETSELCALANENGVKAGVNFNYRQNAMVREMHACIHGDVSMAGEEWGRTYLVHGKYIQDWMMYDTDYNWRCIESIGGPSRTVADIGSHWFDAVQYIVGSKIVKVNAELTTVLDKRKKFTGTQKTFSDQEGSEFEWVDISSEDAAFIMVEFENGVKGLLLLSQISGGRKNDFEITVDGSRYSMTWSQENCDKLLVGHRKLGNFVRYAGPDMLHGDALRYATLPAGHPVGWHDALRNGMREFYSAVRGETQQDNYATFEDADYIVKIVEACLKSNAVKGWVSVEG